MSHDRGSETHRRSTFRARVSPRLEALWLEHRTWISALAATLRPRGTELEDLLQEVALKVLRGFDDLRDDVAVRAWLRSITKNVCTDAGRRQRLRTTESCELTAIAVNGDRELERVEQRDEVERVQLALATLPESARELLALRAIRGLTQRQIAETLELTETAVEQRLVRARRALRRALEQPIDTARRTTHDHGETNGIVGRVPRERP
ncbi:MAG: sigma-70 family RNA polymerase sigma factor [Planctomycetes bacterium]|nr:sigma-70 family RNA polymerase sigma factor [Planctomycetota bacterium]